MVTSTCPLSEVARAKNDLAGATNASVRLVGVPAEGPDRAPSRRSVRATPGCGARVRPSLARSSRRSPRGCTPAALGFEHEVGTRGSLRRACAGAARITEKALEARQRFDGAADPFAEPEGRPLRHPRQLVSVDDFLQRRARGVRRLRRLREEEKEQRSPLDALFHREIPEADRTVLAKELVEGDQLVAVQGNHAERNGPTARRARAGDDEPYVSARRQEGRHVQSGAQRAGTDRAASTLEAVRPSSLTQVTAPEGCLYGTGETRRRTSTKTQAKAPSQ